MEEPQPATSPRDGGDDDKERGRGALLVLALSCCGIVFGDLATSPIYAFREAFAVLEPTEDNVVGVLSLVLLALTLTVTVKYLAVLCYVTGPGGSGGTLAITRALRNARAPVQAVLPTMSVVAVALFLADSAVTPGVSVLSAVEGIGEVVPALQPHCTHIAVGFLSALFFAQRFGPGPLGKGFGPVMLCFFAAMSAGGAHALLRTGQLGLPLRALNPMHALAFCVRRPAAAWTGLSSVLLAVTGCEALYSDVALFGRLPIQLAWGGAAAGSLLLCYSGQAAVLLDSAASAEERASPFFALAPPEWRGVMVALATAATLIASQSVISGTFAVVEQAMALGYAPARIAVVKLAHGQIYIPSVNAALWTVCVLIVLAFRHSSQLASAYGLAVTGAMLLDSLLLAPVFATLWGWDTSAAILAAAPFVVVDVLFFCSGASKFFAGAWLSALLALVLIVGMSTVYEARAPDPDANAPLNANTLATPQ